MSDNSQEICTTVEDGRHTAKIAGEATIYNAAELKARLVSTLIDSKEMKLDLTEVIEIDTAGLQILLMLQREAKETGRALQVGGISAPVREMLRLYGLEGTLAVAAEAGATP